MFAIKQNKISFFRRLRSTYLEDCAVRNAHFDKYSVINYQWNVLLARPKLWADNHSIQKDQQYFFFVFYILKVVLKNCEKANVKQISLYYENFYFQFK